MLHSLAALFWEGLGRGVRCDGLEMKEYGLCSILGLFGFL
jgi:hypothetical protein